jgi:hypothetical protein
MLFEGDPEPTPPEGLATIARFESPMEAQMAKDLIQAAFRVRLQVRLEDETAARELLADPGAGISEG